jgi:hypothetical protein
VLASRISEIQPADAFFADIFAHPPDNTGAIDPRAQEISLLLWSEAMIAASEPRKTVTKGRRGGPPAPSVLSPAGVEGCLPRLLCALGHPDAAVRSAAVECLGRLAVAPGGWLPGDEALARSSFLAKIVDAWLPKGRTAGAGAALLALVKGVYEQGTAILADSEAAELLLSRALELDGPAAAPVVSLLGTGKKQRGGSSNDKKEASGDGDPLALAPDVAAALSAWMLEQLPLQRGLAGCHAARFLVRVLGDGAPPALLLSSAVGLLNTIAMEPAEGGRPAAMRPLQSDTERALAAELMEVFTAEAIQGLQGSSDMGEVLEVLLAAVASSGVPGTSASRLAALKCLTPELYQVLPEEYRRRAFEVSTGLFFLCLWCCWNGICSLGAAVQSFRCEDFSSSILRPFFSPGAHGSFFQG